jgi:hypothetical protein
MVTEKILTMVVAKESKVNKNGEPYGVISIMDNSNVLNLVTKDHALFNDVEVFKKYEVKLDIVLGKYTQVKIVDFVPCSKNQ